MKSDESKGGELLVRTMLLGGALAFPLMTVGCDEQTETAPVASAAPAKTAAPAAVTPPPKPEPEAKPKKKFEDCEKVETLTFENKDLEAAIRVKAQKPEGELKISDLKKLRSLNLTRVLVEELDVCLFHHMTELREFFIGPVGIDDISPLSNSKKLESLGLAMNPVEDLSPLSEMTKLDRLDLSNTKVVDLSPLSEMTLMTELTLDGAPATDLSPLSKMTKLERLSVKKTQVKDVSVLAEMKDIKFVYVAESDVDIGSTSVVVKNGGKVITE